MLLFHHRISTHLLLLLLPLLLTAVCQVRCKLKIEDQPTPYGKLFYYKLPLNETERQSIAKIELSQANPADPRIKLPPWLLFTQPEYELIGFPLSRHKGRLFFFLQIEYQDGHSDNDVFSVEVTDPAQQKLPSASSSFDASHQCQLKLNYTFDTAKDVWQLVSYLIPTYVQASEPAVREWAFNYFSFQFAPTPDSSSSSNDQSFKYQVQLDNQRCSSDPEEREDTRYKLSKFGTQFSVIKPAPPMLVHPAHHVSADDDNDHYAIHQASNYLYKRRRELHNSNNQIYTTPTLLPEWMSMTASLASSDKLEPSVDDSSKDLLSRVVPSVTTPITSLQTAVPPNFPSGALPEQSSNQLSYDQLATPQLTPLNFNKFKSQIYSTPALLPEPTDLFTYPSDLITPTPTLTFVISDTVDGNNLFEQTESIPFGITPTPSIDQVPAPTSTIVSGSAENEVPSKMGSAGKPATSTTTTTTTTSTEQPVVHNRPPTIRGRIPKLRLTSGVYWRYTIPEDTFYDFEDGNTRNLKLAFSLDNSDVPMADYFIQFDQENQILYALPTEDNIGRHKFLLTAVDSQGELVSDELEVSVVQHKLSRSFTHKFILEHVNWSSQYRSMVDAVYNLMKKIAQLFNDKTTDAIFVQKVEEKTHERARISDNSVLGNEENRFWSIFWTNSSLKTYPCPNNEIMGIFEQLSDIRMAREKQPAKLSVALVKLLDHDYNLKEVKYQLSATCSRTQTPSTGYEDKRPQLRNEIKSINFTLGQPFVFVVPPDTFWSPKPGNSRDLLLDLLTPNGYPVDNKKDCVGFNSQNQTIFGLTLNEKCIGENTDFRLIATDPLSGETAFDTFVIEILPDPHKNYYTFEITLQLIPNVNTDMDLQSKIQIAQTFASSILNVHQSDIKVLRMRKQRAQLTYKNNYDYHKGTGQEARRSPNETSRRRRDVSSAGHYSGTSNTRFFYEYVLTTAPLANETGCPAERIQNEIVHKVFSSTSDVDGNLPKYRELFRPDYELVYLGFRTIGKCKSYSSPHFMGSKLAAEQRSNEIDVPHTTEQPVTVPSQSKPGPQGPDDYIFNPQITISLLIKIGAIFLLIVILIYITIKCQRRHDKNRFDVTPSHIGETESFLQKGRVPVIFESDINPNAHLYNQRAYATSMTAMRPMNRTAYHQLPLHGTTDQQRTHPPPYK